MERRRVNLGVLEFHNPRLNPGLIHRFYEVTDDLRASASIIDVWLMDIAKVLSEFGYSMEIYSTAQPAPSTTQQRPGPATAPASNDAEPTGQPGDEDCQ